MTVSFEDLIIKQMEYYWANDVMYVFTHGSHDINLLPREIKKEIILKYMFKF